MNYDAVTSHESALNALPVLKANLVHPAVSAKIPLTADRSQLGALVWLFVDPRQLTRAIVQDMFLDVLKALRTGNQLSTFSCVDIIIADRLSTGDVERYAHVTVKVAQIDDAIAAFSRRLDECVKGQYECYCYLQVD